MVTRFAEVNGAPAEELTSIPYSVMWALGLFRALVKELQTTRYQFTRPFTVGSSATTDVLDLKPITLGVALLDARGPAACLTAHKMFGGTLVATLSSPGWQWTARRVDRSEPLSPWGSGVGLCLPGRGDNRTCSPSPRTAWGSGGSAPVPRLPSARFTANHAAHGPASGPRSRRAGRTLLPCAGR